MRPRRRRTLSRGMLGAAGPVCLVLTVCLLGGTESFAEACLRLIVQLANIRAQVVLPTPRGPQKRKACANWLFLMAFFRVVVICDCPTTVEKSWGLYFRAETINLSII